MLAKPWMSNGLAAALDGAARGFIVLGLLSVTRAGFAATGDTGWLPIEAFVLAFAVPLAWAGVKLRRSGNRPTDHVAFQAGLRALTIGYCFKFAVIVAIAVAWVMALL